MVIEKLTFSERHCHVIFQASIQPADLKYQNFVSKWTRLHCSLALELRFTLHKKADGKTHFSNLKVCFLFVKLMLQF
jgi:hypothetical protein